MAPAYLVTCWNCLGEFDAVGAVWCSDDPKNPTKLCPFCLHCFCDASAEYKQQFWRHAPPQLVEELQTLSKSQDRLGDILIRMKKITTPQLLEALVEQRETGAKLGEILLARRFVTREDVDAALRSQGVTRLTDTKGGADAGTVYWQQSNPDSVLDYLLALGARKRASDVSLEPQPDHVAVRYRIDGFSFRVDPVPKSFEASLERALFAMFGLDPARRGRPQTGRTTARLGEDDFDLVIQTVPGPQGVSATVKLINRSTFIKDFATLGLELEDRVRLVEEIRSGLGLVLVTSPAYNGAITTSYAIMSFLAQGQRDVLSIESPVHWAMDGVRQVEAEAGPQGPRIEETLRAMVAVRPDVLMLSAVPDYGTAVVASQLASSLLVVGQATAATAARGLVALRELGVPAQLLASSLGLAWASASCARSAASARCPRRRPPPRPWPPTASTGTRRRRSRSSRARAAPPATRSATAGAGPSSRRSRRAPRSAPPSSAAAAAKEVEAAALESGMITIRERALALVRTGVTTFDEFARLRL